MTRRQTIVLLTTLYFAQGLPFGFFSEALPVLMRDAGYSLLQISATGLLYLPWALKFLWAPYVDALGTRKRWLLTLQWLAASGALLLATVDLDASLRILFVVIAVTNVLAATQDIATDGIAVNLLGHRERGWGNGIQVGAYRVGMIAGGGALLWLYAEAGWRPMFLTMAALLAAAAIPALRLREPARAPGAHASPAGLAVGWWARLRKPGMVTFVALIVLYKFGDSMGSALVGPFMRDSGLTVAQIAIVKGAVASSAGLVGAVVGGWLAYRFGRSAALLIGGLLQTVALGIYLTSALGIGGFPLIAAGVVAEHVFGGMATVALFALMMDASSRDHAGSDYTLLASAIVIGQGLASFAAGGVGHAFGYVGLFATSAVLSALGCLALTVALRRELLHLRPLLLAKP
jgi:MFS family permease